MSTSIAFYLLLLALLHVSLCIEFDDDEGPYRRVYSIEHQILLKDSNWRTKHLRDINIQEVKELLRKTMMFHDENVISSEKVFREQTYYHGHCLNTRGRGNLRRRVWHGGRRDGMVSIDAKVADDPSTKAQALAQTVHMPSPHYLKNTTTDVEEEKHICRPDRRFSTTTKLFLDANSDDAKLNSCDDVERLFPNLVNSSVTDKFIFQGVTIIYQFYYEARYLFPLDDSELVLQIELEYPSMEDAKSGKHLKEESSEISLTLVKKTDDFHPYIEYKVNEAWLVLISKYAGFRDKACYIEYEYIYPNLLWIFGLISLIVTFAAVCHYYYREKLFYNIWVYVRLHCLDKKKEKIDV